MEGADIYQIAKNCRTSVEMIEKYYASHIKNTLDAAAINVRKPKPRPRKAAKATEARTQITTVILGTVTNFPWRLHCRPAINWPVCGRGGIGRRNGLKRS